MEHHLGRLYCACLARAAGGALAVTACLVGLILPAAARATAGTRAVPSGYVGPTDGSAPALSYQVVPHDSALDVALQLDVGVCSLPVTVPGPGQLSIVWFLGAHPSSTSTTGLTAVARGSAAFGRSGVGRIAITETVPGRYALRHQRRMALTAVATFTPAAGLPMSVVSTFTLA